ncbi:MAG: PTS sugar transporter subunit IIA, partial [Tepidanaerobacteraceae bacterium]
ALIDNGFVKEQFLLDIYKREAMGPAVINKIAIPHGRPENVIKPAIGIAIFKEPIPWWNEIVVDCVFMLALKEDSKDIIRQLYALIKNTEFINKLKCCSNEAEVRSSILEYFLIYN